MKTVPNLISAGLLALISLTCNATSRASMIWNESVIGADSSGNNTSPAYMGDRIGEIDLTSLFEDSTVNFDLIVPARPELTAETAVGNPKFYLVDGDTLVDVDVAGSLNW